MATESPEQMAWRKEFEAMSPVQKRSVIERDPAEFRPSPRQVFWCSLFAEENSNKLDAREDDALAIARAANTIALAAAVSASDANDIARSAKKYAHVAAAAAIIAAAISIIEKIKW